MWSERSASTDLLFGRFRADGISVTSSVPWRDGTSRNRVSRSSSLDAHGPFVPLRGSRSRNTLGGSESKQPTASSSWWLQRTKDWYPRDKWQHENFFARQLYYSFLSSASGGRYTTTYMVDEEMTQDITHLLHVKTATQGESKAAWYKHW